MDTLSYKTVSANKATVTRQWYVVDATDKVVGRIATEIAHVLRGKNKPFFTPHVDCGDYVIIINADKVRFTGSKLDTKAYKRYSGYPGGQKSRTPKQMLAAKPTFVIEHAVKGMLPKNSLGRQMFRKLFAYAGAEHPHVAQKPEPLNK